MYLGCESQPGFYCIRAVRHRIEVLQAALQLRRDHPNSGSSANDFCFTQGVVTHLYACKEGRVSIHIVVGWVSARPRCSSATRDPCRRKSNGPSILRTVIKAILRPRS